MAAKPRVHEIASEVGIDSKVALRKLREMGQFVKGPSSSLQPPVARRLRAALLADLEASVIAPRAASSPPGAAVRQDPPRPEAVAAAVRRDVVRRDESDWSTFGFSDNERSAWMAAGVPDNKAHVAAMVRDSELRTANPARLTSANLSTRVNSAGEPETVLSALLNGTNSLRVQERLSGQMGVAISGVNADLLRLTTSLKLAPEVDARDLGSAVRAFERVPINVPKIADAMASVLSSLRPAALAQHTFYEQVDAYQRERTVSPLLAALARTYGVFHAGDVLDTLCSGFIGSAMEYAGAISFIDLATASIAARRFYFLRPDAVARSESAATPAGIDAFLPSGHGVALLAARDEDDRPRILFWTTMSTGTRCVITPLSTFTSPTVKRLVEVGAQIHPWEPGGYRGEGQTAASLLDALAASRMRVPGTGRRSTRTESEPLPNDSPTTLRDTVVSYYAPDSVSENPDGQRRARRAPDHQWMVTGHMRRQWYPASNEHRPVWIVEHRSGPSDRPLLLAERVEVH